MEVKSSELPLLHEKRERVPSQFKGGIVNKRAEIAKFERLSNSIEIDEFSKKIFELSNKNVAFVGVYDESTNKLYLHPLVPWTDHYSTNAFEIVKEDEDILNSIIDKQASNTTKLPTLTPITHIQGKSPSHGQLCDIYGLNRQNCVGFSITKGEDDGVHIFNAQSISLNRSKFQQLTGHEKIGDEMGYLPREYIQFLMAGLKSNLPELISYCDLQDGTRTFETFMDTRPKPTNSNTSAMPNLSQENKQGSSLS